jgi:hypothetical protein
MTKAINSRFCSVFERSKTSAAREATEIRLSSVVLSLAFLVLLNAQSDLVLPALQLARLFVVFVLRNTLIEPQIQEQRL